MICRRAEALFWQSDGCLVVVLPLSWTRRELKSLCRLYATTDTTRSSIGPTLDVRLNRLCTAPTTATFVTKSRYVVPVPRSSHRQTDRQTDTVMLTSRDHIGVGLGLASRRPAAVSTSDICFCLPSGHHYSPRCKSRPPVSVSVLQCLDV